MNRLDELENAIKNAEKNIANLRNEFEELKKNSESAIPENVEDIPKKYDFDDYTKLSESWRRAWIMNYKGELLYTEIDRVGWKGNMIFPTKEFAEMFREKAELIADCLLFKWLYDREYVPDWSNSNENKHFVSLDFSKDIPEYVNEYYYCYDYNCVCFSTEQIAEKCAEWLNYRRGNNETKS